MQALPEDIKLILVRGLGAYLRATPPQDLPPNLRRMKGFRDVMLARHREEVLALLEDETDRALVKQWIDDGRPSLKKDALEVLRIAAVRDEGWEERLAALSTGEEVVAADPKTDDDAALDREKHKTRKAKEELRRARSAHDEALRAEVALRERLTAELGTAKSRIEELERDLTEAVKEAAAAREGASREIRRARAEADKANARADGAVRELKDMRKELERLDDEIRALRDAAKPKPKAGKRVEAKPPEGPRRPLPVPKGRLDDDPATLESWLEVPGVILVLDGYNVTKAERGYAALSLEKQRERLIDEAGKLVQRSKVEAYLVFDGADVGPHPKRGPRSGLKVQYSAPGVIADDHIEDLIASLPPYPVVLVTNDKELQDRGRSHGATVATSDQFLALIH